ncbi:MAG: HD domain-containing protein [Candidatus Altimarinota bacterium]
MEKYVQDLFDLLCAEIIKYNPYYNKVLLEKAFLFAYDAHKGIYRKSKELYITHPLSIAIHLTKIEADEISIVSALLHDVLDNKKITLGQIEKQFGAEVASIVKGVTQLGNLYYTLDMNKKDIENLKQSLVSVGDDIRIFLVKIADRFHNLETLEYLPKKKRYRIACETKEIYLPIVNFLSIGEFLSQMHDLCFQYIEEDEYKKLHKVFGKKYEYHKQKIIEAHNKIQKEFSQIKLQVVNIEGRVKSLYSIYNKIKNKNIDYKEIYDVLALRVITKTTQEAYIALGVIHKLYNVKNDRFKDYISTPKENGYQSIHTTVYDENGDFLEFQIQTQGMSKLNKSGLAAHFIYKGFGVEYKELPNWMKGVLDIQKKTIDSKSFFEKLSQEIIISEIKCFDSKGEYILLPKNSVLIDYAFSYSLDSGKFFSGAHVNGVLIEDPFYQLKNGDFIKLKNSNKIYIDYKIENFFLLKTKVSREQIKGLFKKYAQTKAEQLGEYLLNSQLENLGFRHFGANPQKVRKSVIKSVGLRDEQQLYLFVALGSLPVEKVVNKISQLNNKEEYNKEVSLKIKFKTKDFLSLNNITKTFYDLDIEMSKIVYRENKNYASVSFVIDSNTSLNELLKELKRIPNVSYIRRIFPLRLKLYYVFYALSLFIITAIIFTINFLDISKYQKNLFLELVLFGSSFFMLFIVFFLKFIVKTILPDVLKYKRFWLSLFFLNTFIFFIIFWEILFLGFNVNFILYFLFCFFMYIMMFYEFLVNKKLKK